MELSLYQLDAFTQTRFKGNPAAVVPLDSWLPESTLQAIAAENNLSETAFFVPVDSGFHLRWFTPKTEVKLCGHATLATAEVIFSIHQYAQPTLVFQTLSGPLTVSRLEDGRLELDLPAQPVAPVSLSTTALAQLHTGLGIVPVATLAHEDLVVVCESASAIAALTPDFSELAKLPFRGIIVTATGDDCDFVSRFFGPSVGVNEDPVTGSAHTKLMPYWSARLGKTRCQARQLSARGGHLECELVADRVKLRGWAMQYLRGTITV